MNLQHHIADTDSAVLAVNPIISNQFQSTETRLLAKVSSRKGMGIIARSLFPVLIEIDFVRTEGEIKVCTWLREICSCSCLTVLPGPAWVLLNKICKEYISSLYIHVGCG